MHFVVLKSTTPDSNYVHYSALNFGVKKLNFVCTCISTQQFHQKFLICTVQHRFYMHNYVHTYMYMQSMCTNTLIQCWGIPEDMVTIHYHHVHCGHCRDIGLHTLTNPLTMHLQTQLITTLPTVHISMCVCLYVCFTDGVSNVFQS